MSEFGPPNCEICGYAHHPSLDCGAFEKRYALKQRLSNLDLHSTHVAIREFVREVNRRVDTISGVGAPEAIRDTLKELGIEL